MIVKSYYLFFFIQLILAFAHIPDMNGQFILFEKPEDEVLPVLRSVAVETDSNMVITLIDPNRDGLYEVLNIYHKKYQLSKEAPLKNGTTISFDGVFYVFNYDPSRHTATLEIAASAEEFADIIIKQP